MKWEKFFMLFDFSRRIPFSSAPSDQLGNVVKVSTGNMASKLWKLFKLVLKFNCYLINM